MITITLKRLQKLLDEHRKKAFINCDTNCFCWDIQAYINSFEPELCILCHRDIGNDDYITMPYGSKYDSDKLCGNCLIEKIG